MPFRIGKSDKKREEQAGAQAATEELAATAEMAPLEEELLDPIGELDEVEVEGETEDTAEAASPDEHHDETPTGEPGAAPRFRPSFLDPVGGQEQSPRSPGARPSSRHERPGAPAIFVVVRGEPGEAVSVQQFSAAGEARAHVEALLESGTGEERISVFKGIEVLVQVTRRPVIRLVPKED